MAEWNKNKVDPINLHGGQEFSKGDNLAIDELNAIVNNSFYASEKASRAIELAEGAVEGQGTPVTLNGEILSTWSADFAESERQKSKNLWDNKKILTDYLADICVPSATGLKLTTQHKTGSSYASASAWSMNLKAGVTYTLSCKHINYTTPSGTVFCRWVTASGNVLWIPNFNTTPTQFTPSEDIVGVQFYLQSGTVGTYVEVEDIQIEEGSVATEYQPYNGQIVHEKELLNKVYPIGSIYLSVNDTSPASILGGTWEKIQDRFLLASGSYALGEEGGSTSHNHSLNNGFAKIGYTWLYERNNTLFAKMKYGVSFIPDVQTSNDNGYDTGGLDMGGAVELGGTTDTTSNLPPYLVVNMWERVE